MNREKCSPSSRVSWLYPFVTIAGTAVGETSKSTLQTGLSDGRGTTKSSVPPAGTLALATCLPPIRATIVCGFLKIPGSLASPTVSAPPLQASRVYDAYLPDHVSSG